ncbi:MULTISPECIES: hypothetical protein [unclassified Paracoccus (in: a-proteobacteria)]|uniref:hypothetical protein n=1 Tax=unclassified Paracoccus (in: a-proteobacteria) TaxID=2688777 RepID=UPI001601C02B|nr:MULTISPECIES: hypothetical protein [unclassified Paracoccus (in: a-proteobacteria)]MBB1491317.1 hypothetical protein [Paracoccus sp. MC1854]MBB1498095.1 hypothetical protein [Paracoccus sp. MC1862]QQO46223.1 hypothetical protein JGR78_08235 [Paracoccus sp. MC1862]
MRMLLLMLLAATMALTVQPRVDAEGLWLVAPAFADDDDGPRRRSAAPARPIPLPQRAENEILARGLSDQGLAALQHGDFALLEQGVLGGGDSIARLRKPTRLTMDEALAAVRQLVPAGRSDFNHFYRTEQAEACKGIDCPARRAAAAHRHGRYRAEPRARGAVGGPHPPAPGRGREPALGPAARARQSPRC